MKTLSQFITEAYTYVRYTTHKEIVDAIASHKKAGEIVNPVYQDLVNQAKRVYEDDAGEGNDMILSVSHAGDAAGQPRDPDITDLYYAWPRYSFQSFTKFEKTLLKVEKMNKKKGMQTVIKVGKELIANWKPVAEDLKMLKGKVVKITAKRAEAKQVAAKEMGARFADSSSLIKVLESHLDEYKAMAKQRAKEFIEKRLEFLSKHDWDLNKAFPPWRGGLGADYKARASQENLLSSITKTKGSYTGRRNDPHIVEPDQQKIDRYVANSVKDAEASYREFMQKMITKIGKPVVDAVMKGNIWTNAVLTVTTNDGEQQVWNTKMILNFSKYQKMFNQFPTRRKK
jgi:hypothetical protein